MTKEKEPTIELVEIDEPSKAIKLYKITPTEISAKLKDFDHLKVIEGDTESYKEVRAALTILVHTRTGIDAHRLHLGVKLRKSLGHINKAGEMLSEPMAPYEKRFNSELKVEDARKDAIKKKKARIEEERVQGIRAEIFTIQTMTGGINLMDLEALQKLSGRLEDMNITEKEYMEFTEEAEKVLDDTYSAVQVAIVARFKLDEEEKDRKAEDARLEKLKTKLGAVKKKADVAQKKLDDDKAEFEDVKKEAALEKTATEKAEATAAQKVIDDAAAKAEKDRLEEVEKERKEAMAPDKEKLIKWVASFNETNNPSPQLKSKKAKEIFQTAYDEIVIILQQAEDKAEKL